MALFKQVQETYRDYWTRNAFSNIPFILSWDENIVQAWLSAGPNAKYPADATYPEVNQISTGDCHVFTMKLLAAISELCCTSTLLHNKYHGAAIINPSSDFIVIDSQAATTFQLAPDSSWESVPTSPSKTPSKWSRMDERAVVLNGRKFEEVDQEAFIRRACNVQYTKKQAVVLLRIWIEASKDMRGYGDFACKILMDKKERKVLVYLWDLLCHEAILSSEEILVDTQQILHDVVAYLAKDNPEVTTQWNAIVKDVHKLLKLFTSDVVEKSN